MEKVTTLECSVLKKSKFSSQDSTLNFLLGSLSTIRMPPPHQGVGSTCLKEAEVLTVGTRDTVTPTKNATQKF